MTDLIDVHCHYEDARFDADRDAVLSGLPEKGVSCVIDAACTVDDGLLVARWAEKHPFLWFCAGVHPEHADRFSPQALEDLKALWRHPKCVGVGEIGLDFHWKENPPEKTQIEAFLLQADAAKEAELPVVIHTRDAIGDMLSLLREHRISFGVMHCFSESRETAKVCLDQGLHFSFGGVCTFKNARKTIDVLRYLPRDRVLLETDSPYLSPEPRRGERNDSSNLVFVAEKLATLWNCTPQEAADITAQNARRIFNKLNA